MVVGWHRPTRLIIDEAAIAQNIKHQLNHLPANCKLFAVVKANGYGHGAIKVAQIAAELGVTGFCVALLDEAVELREAGIEGTILIMSPVDLVDLGTVIKHDFSVTVSDINWLNEAVKEIKKLELYDSYSVKLHLKVDTGMGRLGFQTNADILAAYAVITRESLLQWEGIFTHYATADEENYTYFDKQQEKFNEVLNVLPSLPPFIHAENSAGALWHLHQETKIVRFGLAMYGLNPNPQLKPTFPLTPALSLETELIQVKKVVAGTSIGYGITYSTKDEEWIGTIPIGYADGWRRSMQGSFVLVDGHYCEIVGRVCMDLCMIRLPKYYSTGTKVTLIGKNKDKEIPIDEIAKKMRTINYEVITAFSNRIPRIYK